VTEEVLPALGVQPALGRAFSAADDSPGTPETIILTHGYWQRRFGGDSAVLGRVVTIDSRPREVIGVMPQDFTFLNLTADVILPQRFDRSDLPPSDNFNYQGIARLKSGVTLAQANADVARMLPIWVERYGVNRANLLLVKAAGREHELAIRTAVGAGPARVAGQLLVESVLLGLLGGALGLGLAYGGLHVLIALGPTNLPRLAEISIDPVVLSFALVVSALSGLLFGVIPVVKYAGSRLATVLRGGGRGGSQSRERRLSQNALVVIQVALALVILVGSGLMLRSFQALLNVEPGFASPERLQLVRVSMPPAQVAEPERVIRMQNEILERFTAIPGVTSAAFTTGMPMELGFLNNYSVSAEGITEERQLPPIRRARRGASRPLWASVSAWERPAHGARSLASSETFMRTAFTSRHRRQSIGVQACSRIRRERQAPSLVRSRSRFGATGLGPRAFSVRSAKPFGRSIPIFPCHRYARSPTFALARWRGLRSRSSCSPSPVPRRWRSGSSESTASSRIP